MVGGKSQVLPLQKSGVRIGFSYDNGTGVVQSILR